MGVSVRKADFKAFCIGSSTKVDQSNKEARTQLQMLAGVRCWELFSPLSVAVVECFGV